MMVLLYIKVELHTLALQLRRQNAQGLGVVLGSSLSINGLVSISMGKSHGKIQTSMGNSAAKSMGFLQIFQQQSIESIVKLR